MLNSKIFQIYYNQSTKDTNDSGFIPLNNISNQRSDWSEYWPIRNYLLENILEEDCYYAFLSPKFFEKTGINSTFLKSYLDSSTEDIIAFSPYFDQSAFFLNIFHQGAANHPSIQDCFDKSFKYLNNDYDINSTVMTSIDTIFCNFFAAKKHIWIEWFNNCEKIFNIAEQSDCELSLCLRKLVSHSNSSNPAKVFVIERMISYLIYNNPLWSINNFINYSLPHSKSLISKFEDSLYKMDSLKISYKLTNHPKYLKLFSEEQTYIINSINQN